MLLMLMSLLDDDININNGNNNNSIQRSTPSTPPSTPSTTFNNSSHRSVGELAQLGPRTGEAAGEHASRSQSLPTRRRVETKERAW